MFKPEDLKIERGEDKLVEYKFGTKKNSYKVNIFVHHRMRVWLMLRSSVVLLHMWDPPSLHEFEHELYQRTFFMINISQRHTHIFYRLARSATSIWRLSNKCRESSRIIIWISGSNSCG
jgi:hypothetical protein